MLNRIEWHFAGDDDAKAGIRAAVKYLLKDATGSERGQLVREIAALVDFVADGLPPSPYVDSPDGRVARQAPVAGVIYRDYVIDTFRRDVDRWRATIRRLDGKKIRVAMPPAVLDEATTSADALTAEKAVELAKKAIDRGGVI